MNTRNHEHMKSWNHAIMNTCIHEHIVRLEVDAENKLYGSKTFFLYHLFMLSPILTELKPEAAFNYSNPPKSISIKKSISLKSFRAKRLVSLAGSQASWPAGQPAIFSKTSFFESREIQTRLFQSRSFENRLAKAVSTETVGKSVENGVGGMGVAR